MLRSFCSCFCWSYCKLFVHIQQEQEKNRAFQDRDSAINCLNIRHYTAIYGIVSTYVDTMTLSTAGLFKFRFHPKNRFLGCRDGGADQPADLAAAADDRVAGAGAHPGRDRVHRQERPQVLPHHQRQAGGARLREVSAKRHFIILKPNA